MAPPIYVQDLSRFRGAFPTPRVCPEVDWLSSVGLPTRPGPERCGVRGRNPQGGPDEDAAGELVVDPQVLDFDEDPGQHVVRADQ